MNASKESSPTSSLIVDFPHPYTVTFSAMSTGKYVPYPTAEEKEAGWYSKKDERRFLRDRQRDAEVCSLRLAGSSVNEPHELEIQDILGLDHLISEDRFHARKSALKKHVQKVLKEQEVQKWLGTESIEDLARVASMSSRRSRGRARKVGILVEKP
eukprot:scaffold105774_cov62-Cyclotella_meneghiniana.AAC.2